MADITIGQISSALAIIVALIGSIAYLKTHIMKWIAGAVKEDFEEIKDDLKSINDRLDTVDLESCKNYLVSELTKIEQGGWWDEIEKERFYEQYEHYQKLGGNTYIQQKVERLQKEGKI